MIRSGSGFRDFSGWLFSVHRLHLRSLCFFVYYKIVHTFPAQIALRNREIPDKELVFHCCNFVPSSFLYIPASLAVSFVAGQMLKICSMCLHPGTGSVWEYEQGRFLHDMMMSHLATLLSFPHLRSFSAIRACLRRISILPGVYDSS